MRTSLSVMPYLFGVNMTKQISVYPNAELYFFDSADEASDKIKELGVKHKGIGFNEFFGNTHDGRFIGIVCANKRPESVKEVAPKLSVAYHDKVGLKRTPASCERVSAIFAAELMGLIDAKVDKSNREPEKSITIKNGGLYMGGDHLDFLTIIEMERDTYQMVFMDGAVMNCSYPWVWVTASIHHASLNRVAIINGLIAIDGVTIESSLAWPISGGGSYGHTVKFMIRGDEKGADKKPAIP